MVKFVDTYDRICDKKGRVNLPYKEGRWLLTTNRAIGRDLRTQYVVAFTDEGYETFRDRVEPYQLKEGHRDKQGRVIIPQELREYAHLERNVLVQGKDLVLNIWNPENWNRYVAEKSRKGLLSRVPRPLAREPKKDGSSRSRFSPVRMGSAH